MDFSHPKGDKYSGQARAERQAKLLEADIANVQSATSTDADTLLEIHAELIKTLKEAKELREQAEWEANPRYLRMSPDDRLLRSQQIWRQFHKYDERATIHEREVLNVQFHNEYGVFLRDAVELVLLNPDDMHILDNPKRFLPDWSKRIEQNNKLKDDEAPKGRYSFEAPGSPTPRPVRLKEMIENMHAEADKLATRRAKLWKTDPLARTSLALEKMQKKEEKKRLDLVKQQQAKERAEGVLISALPADEVAASEGKPAPKKKSHFEIQTELYLDENGNFNMERARMDNVVLGRKSEYGQHLEDVSETLAWVRELESTTKMTNDIMQRYHEGLARLQNQKDAEVKMMRGDMKKRTGRSSSVPISTKGRRLDEAKTHAEWHALLKDQNLAESNIPEKDAGQELEERAIHRASLKRGRGEEEPFWGGKERDKRARRKAASKPAAPKPAAPKPAAPEKMAQPTDGKPAAKTAATEEPDVKPEDEKRQDKPENQAGGLPGDEPAATRAATKRAAKPATEPVVKSAIETAVEPAVEPAIEIKAEVKAEDKSEDKAEAKSGAKSGASTKQPAKRGFSQTFESKDEDASESSSDDELVINPFKRRKTAAKEEQEKPRTMSSYFRPARLQVPPSKYDHPPLSKKPEGK